MKNLIFLLLFIPFCSFSQNKVTSGFIDSLVNLSLEKFPQAGVAIGVIQEGQVTHLKGYGLASKNSNTLVNKNTLFAIASNSKAFTSTALGMLVDRGQLKWTDKVVKHIPEFKMYNTYVTENFTILGGNIKVYDASNGGMVRSCDVLSQFPDGEFLVTDISSDVLSNLSCSDFTGFEYEDQDSIVVCVFYKTKDELINVDSEIITYNTLFYASDDAYALGDTARCNFLFDNLQQIGIRNYHNDVISFPK